MSRRKQVVGIDQITTSRLNAPRHRVHKNLTTFTKYSERFVQNL